MHFGNLSVVTKSQDTKTLVGGGPKKIPKFTKPKMNDEVECDWCFSRILGSFPCPSCENKLTGGGAAFLQPSPYKRSGSIFGHSSCIPHMHIPLECLVTSFSQRSMYTWVIFICHVGTTRSSVWFPETRFALWTWATW